MVKVDSWPAWRMFFLDPDSGSLRGEQAYYAGSWAPGINTSVCVHFDHPAPNEWCRCGFSVAYSLSAAAAYADQSVQAIHAGAALHNASGAGFEMPTGHLERAVLTEVQVGGLAVDADAQDQREWFYRVQYAAVRRVWLPANMAQHSAVVAAQYRAQVEIADTTGREFFASFADEHGPTAEDLGCGMCPRPNPGPDQYPLCDMCRNRGVSGRLFGLDPSKTSSWLAPKGGPNA